MKIAPILAFVAILSATQVLAQGTITFSGITVRNPDSSLVTSNQGYLGELVFAPDGSTDQFDALAVRLGTIGAVGAPLAGRITGGTRTAPTTTPGGFGLFQVRVWRGSDGPDWRAVVATGNPNFLVTESPIVRIDTGDPTTVPPGTPTPFPTMTLTLHPVPEPSVIALAVLGAGALFMLRRRRQ